MKLTEDNFISDEHFDVLLRHALLDSGKFSNEKTLDQMAKQAFAAASAEDISAADNNSIVEKLLNDFKPRGNNFRLNIFLLSIFAILTMGIVVFFTSQKKSMPPSNQDFSPVVLQHNNADSAPPAIITHEQLTSNGYPRQNPLMLVLIDSCPDSELVSMNNMNNVFSPSSMTTFHIPKDNVKHYEDIPDLTEAEKTQTAKDKLKMLKDIANPKKKIYSYVPAGSTQVGGAITTVGAINIKSAEVSNLEYRTFLNDLLIQGKFDDYLLAVPVKGLWKAIGIPEFEDVYFENEKYNDFPVVNITRKGAELYCTWMRESLADAIQKKIVKSSSFGSYPDFFLPTKAQWIHAARGGEDSLNVKYPWQFVGNDVANARGCYLCNFNYSISKDHLKPKPDCPKQWNGKLPQGGFHRAIITTAGMAIDTLLTAPVYAYNPNDYGIYCTVGNVSEMAIIVDPTDPKKLIPCALGGNWNSDVNNTMIEAPEQYLGVTDASPMIGFRPVWTWLK